MHWPNYPPQPRLSNQGTRRVVVDSDTALQVRNVRACNVDRLWLVRVGGARAGAYTQPQSGTPTRDGRRVTLSVYPRPSPSGRSRPK